MLIEIRPEIFDGKAKFRDVVLLYYQLIEKGRYDVFIDIETTKRYDVFSKFQNDDLVTMREAYTLQIQNNKKIDYSIGNVEDDKTFNLKEAKYFFLEPVLIFVENDKYDAYFIEALIRSFKKESKKIAKCARENWLRYRSGGGADSIPNTIQSVLREIDKLDLPKDSYNYIRGIVIIDSDKRYKNQPLTKSRQDIIDFCTKNEIEYHVLEKREMENYIPDEVIDTVAFETNDEYLKAYLNLSPLAKDYFDLEKGFSKVNSYSKLSDEEKELFENNEDFKLFRQKWRNENFHGKGISFKSEFPKLFENEAVNKETLLRRTSHQENKNELKQLLQKINDLL